MQPLTAEAALAAAAQFQTEGSARRIGRLGNGHINDTFLVECDRPYVLQRVNTYVFPNPLAVVQNMELVTNFLRREITARGGEPDRETMTLIPAADGSRCFTDKDGNFFRMFYYIENTLVLENAADRDSFRSSGEAFGHFQFLLRSFPVSSLTEVIPGFHDTPARFAAFAEAVREDRAGRAAGCRREIEFLLAREADSHAAGKAAAQGLLPLRVTHNDTKLNNILFDRASGRALCIIDLDTVMPGLSIHDFGDTIRFGASTAAEDERDTSRVSLSLALYEAYMQGFLRGCGGILTPGELGMLPWGARLMTLECALRFLADHLQGDRYFRTAYPEHNLVRARTQIALAADMERKWDEMQRIAKEQASADRGAGRGL